MEPVSFSRVSVVEHSEDLFAPATRRTCAIFRALTHHGQVVELIFHVVPASVHDMVALAHPVQRSRCVLHHRLFRPTTSPAGLRRAQGRAEDGVTQVTSSGALSTRTLGGRGSEMVRRAGGSASELVRLTRSVWGVTGKPGFKRKQKNKNQIFFVGRGRVVGKGVNEHLVVSQHRHPT